MKHKRHHAARRKMHTGHESHYRNAEHDGGHTGAHHGGERHLKHHSPSHHSARHHSSSEYSHREMFAGREMTNEMNAEDGSMIMVRDGMHEMAHMPRNVIIKPYPAVYHFPDEQIMANSDNVKGIDDQMNEDMSGARRHHSSSKY